MIQALACMAAASFFGLILRQPRSTLFFSALIGLLGYAAFTLTGGGLLAYFISGLLVGILCELTARILQRTTTLFLISAIIPTVPGLGMYRSMMALAGHDYPIALAIGVETIAGIGAIALALTIATALFSSIQPLKTKMNQDRRRQHAPIDNQ